MSRSALRLFHQDRTLGAAVAIPRRRREAIRRSRRPVPSDRRTSRTRHQALIDFLHATGLRRREVAALRVGDVEINEFDVCVRVRNGKGGRERLVLVLPGAEGLLPPLVAGQAPEELLFPRIPRALDIQACRRAYAQALYQALSGRELPDPHGRLKPGSYDPESVDNVSWALGHRRLDVVLRHYLR